MEVENILIGEVADVKSGYAFKSEDYLNEGIRLVRIGNLDGKSLVFSEDAICVSEKFKNENSEFLLEANDVLIAMSGATTGKLALVKENDLPCLLNQRVGKFSVIDENKLDSKYLFYYLSNNRNEILKISGGSAQPNISPTQLKGFAIPLPDLKIQQKIASILEQADTARQERKQANQLTEQFLQSAFLEMFGDPERNEKGWKKIRAEELFEMKLGKMLSAKNYTGKHLKPYLRNINVQWDEIDFSDVKEMDFDENDFERYKLQKGDILVCEGGAVGRTAIYNGEIKNCCYQNALHRLRIKNKNIEPKYFLHFMYHATQRGMILKETSTVTIAHFTSEKFKRFEIPLPPLSLQQKFASLVERVEKLRAKQRESEKELENLFQSLMQKYFG